MAVIAPTLITAYADADYHVQLLWSNGEVYRYVDIQRKITGGAYSTLTTKTGGSVSHEDSSVGDGIGYAYQVRGRTATETSDWSNEKTLVVPLGKPSGLSATSSGAGTQAGLTWVDNSQNETGFRAYCRRYGDSTWILGATVGANVLTATISGLTAGATYEFIVRSYNTAAGNSGPSNIATVTMKDPPSAPSLLVVQAIDTDAAQLNWQDNADNEVDFHIERSATSATAGFAEIGTVGANITSYLDETGLVSNTQYWWRVRGHNASGYSGYSNVYTTVTFAAIAAPTNLALTAAKVGGTFGVECTFDDNSSLEDFHCLERRTYTTEKVTDGGLENWSSATNLASWTESVLGSTTINLESSFVYDGVSACRIDVDAANSRGYIYQTITLTSGTAYHLSFRYRTDAGKTASFRFCNSTAAVSLDSDGSWVASKTHTLPPTNGRWVRVGLSFTAHASYTNYLFLIGAYGTGYYSAASSSIYLDGLSIKEAAAYSEIVQLEPNRTYYHDTGVTAGEPYTYRVRAKQGAATYSSYCAEAHISVPTAPPDVSSFQIDEYQDTFVRLSWVPGTAEDGYIIRQSDDNGSSWTDILQICIPGVDHVKITGLTPSAHYHWGIVAYNGVGNSNTSSFMPQVSTSMREIYLRSSFEKLILKSKPSMLFLLEANPLMPLSGWALASGKTYAYETAFDEGGVGIDALYANGVAYGVKASIAEVEATAGTYWHDTLTGMVYIHTADGSAPVNYFVAASFWVYLRMGYEGEVVYNGNNYLPLIPSGGIPDISQEIQPYYEGTFAVSSGDATLINAKVKKAFHFDKKFAKYLWLNRKVRVLVGAPGFTYAEFKAVNTGTVNSIQHSDRSIGLALRDFRDGLGKSLPSELYSLEAFPLMDENAANGARPRAFGFGAIPNAVPVCIDTGNRVFEFQAGRVKTVSVTQNGTALVEDTDYFVDYQRGRVTLARGLAYADSDIILVSFTGCVNLADEAIATGAEIFLHLCTEFLGLTMADMDLDAIYATKLAETTALSLYMRKGEDSAGIIRTIETSIQSYTMQDAEGRLGIRAEQTAAISGAPYVWNCHVHDFAATFSQDRLYAGINVYYDENHQDDVFSVYQQALPAMTWKHGIKKSLDIYTVLSSSAQAQALATDIAGLMERQRIEFTVPRMLYNVMPGDVIYFSRERFPSLSGTAANISVRVLGISKQIGSGKTGIVAEVI